MLIARDLHVSLGGQAVLRGLSLDLAPSEALAVGGPSGAGKTTLGRVLAGHLRPDQGEVTWQGRPLPDRGPSPVQLVPQAPETAVDPRWSVRRILTNAGTAEPGLLEALGIRPSWSDRRPAELSGGELARVSLARFLGPATRVLVCDEITAALDAVSARTLWQALLPIVRDRRIGLVVISHDPGLRARLATRELHLRERLQPTEVHKRPPS
jgi:ABC-type dipeptide/oligopeptide/nickel transport system ATPase subunit